MKEALEFLKNAGIYYLATVEDDQPHVRPVGFAMEYDGNLALCTDNRKKMARQILGNPKIEICCFDGRKTLRISGKAEFITTDESQRKALGIMPSLSSIYSVDDSIFEIYRIIEAKAVMSTMSGTIKEWYF